MKTQNIVIFIGVIVSLIYKSYSFRCDRVPVGIYKPRNRNDAGRYLIDIPGNPKTYSPNQVYNISLKLNPLSMNHRTFKSFIITLEQEPTYNMMESNIEHATGNFEFGQDMLAKFSDRCPNTVIEANSLPKSEIQIFWTAPPPNSGCIAIRATVVESRENWFSEDGPLTKILCEETSENENVQPMVLDYCCACDEAKYEVAFEGLWTRNTHPKDFPSDVWSTKFSDVIGASHKLDHAFWKYGHIASEGLRELAETGSTKTLESELKETSENIRTIIKARGLQYPNITLSTFAVFRVDNQNHLVSLVSKINPSPDWIVGVSNLELCKADCTWEESRVLNLYPWDAGTDDGATYTSLDEPASPKQPIRRIKSNSPNDPRSPFYDETGEEMKPIAKLHLTRQRLYEKVCDESLQPTEENKAEDDCATTDWWEWSACSKLCGKGVMFRQRQYVNPDNNNICNKHLVEEKDCFGQSRMCENYDSETNEIANETCELTDWGNWSSCSATCGTGTKTRDRKLKNPDFESICNIKPANLEENEECTAEEECENVEEQKDDSKCPESAWSEWSKCNVTCGTGFKRRLRMPVKDDYDEDDFIDGSCDSQRNQEIVECYEPPCTEEELENLFTHISTGNHMVAPDVVTEGPVGSVIDCKVSKWSTWSKCEPIGDRCGRGYRSKVRQILVNPINGGQSCPKRLQKKKRCQVPCPEDELDDQSKETLPSWGPANSYDTSNADCIMSKFSRWSPCSTICGSTAVQQRTRTIIRKSPGAICPSRLEERRCPLPLACSNKGMPIF